MGEPFLVYAIIAAMCIAMRWRGIMRSLVMPGTFLATGLLLHFVGMVVMEFADSQDNARMARLLWYLGMAVASVALLLGFFADRPDDEKTTGGR